MEKDMKIGTLEHIRCAEKTLAEDLWKIILNSPMREEQRDTVRALICPSLRELNLAVSGAFLRRKMENMEEQGAVS